MEQPQLLQRAAASFDHLRDNAVVRFLEIGGTAALATLALSGCADQTTYYQAKGVVEQGANGKKYIIPDGAERPLYRTEAACEEDVNKELHAVEKQDNVTLHDKAAQLCEPVSEYPRDTYFPIYYYYYYYGPIVSPGSVWQSSQVASWQTNIPSGSFAASGSEVQGDLEAAPEDDQVGESVAEDEDGEDLGDSPESYPDGSDNESSADDESSGDGESGGDDSGGDDESFGGDDGGDRFTILKLPKNPFSRLLFSWETPPSDKHHGVVKVSHQHKKHTSK